MPRRISLYPHLSEPQLHERYRRTPDPVERSRWRFLWLLARGLTATAIARVTGYSAYWIGQIAHRSNRAGRARSLHHLLLLVAALNPSPPRTTRSPTSLASGLERVMNSGRQGRRIGGTDGRLYPSAISAEECALVAPYPSVLPQTASQRRSIERAQVRLLPTGE